MFDPAPIRRDMEAIFPAGSSSLVDPSGATRRTPRAPVAVRATRRRWSKRRHGLLVLAPLSIVAILVGVLGVAALDRLGIGSAIRSSLSGASSPAGRPHRAPPQGAPTAMLAIPAIPTEQGAHPASGASATDAAGSPKVAERSGRKRSVGYARATRYRWFKGYRRAHVKSSRQTLQRELAEDAETTRRLNAKALSGSRSRVPLNYDVN